MKNFKMSAMVAILDTWVKVSLKILNSGIILKTFTHVDMGMEQF